MNDEKKLLTISVIELDYHASILGNLCRILEDSGFSITVFTTEKIHDEIRGKENFPRYQWFIRSGKEKGTTFITWHLDEINKSDIIFFNTLASGFRIFSELDFTPPVILRVHNANTDLNSCRSFSLILSPRYFLKNISHIIRKSIGEMEPLYRRKFINKVDYLTFPDITIQQNVAKNDLIRHHKVLPPLSFTYHEHKFLKRDPTDKVFITITGTIERRRRDYIQLIRALKPVTGQFQHSVELTLLGKPKGTYGKMVVRRLKKLCCPAFNVKSYNGRVPQDEFERVMTMTDFLILPVHVRTNFNINREIYGYTKTSGSIIDAIHFGKPFIINDHCTLDNDLKLISESYGSNRELSGKILDWVNGMKFKEMEHNLDKAMEKYQLEKIRYEVTNNLSQLIRQKKKN